MSKIYYPAPDYVDITVIENGQAHQMIPVEREIFEDAEQSRHQSAAIKWGTNNTVDEKLNTKLALGIKSPSLALGSVEAKAVYTAVTVHSKNLQFRHTQYDYALASKDNPFLPDTILPPYFSNIHDDANHSLYAIGIHDHYTKEWVCDFDAEAILSYPRYMASLPFDEKDEAPDKMFTLQKDYQLCKTLARNIQQIATANTQFSTQMLTTSEKIRGLMPDNILLLPVVFKKVEPNSLIGPCYGKKYWSRPGPYPALFYKDGRVVEKYFYRHRRFISIGVNCGTGSITDRLYWDEIIHYISQKTALIFATQNGNIRVPLEKINIELAKLNLSIQRLMALMIRENELLEQVDQLFAQPLDPQFEMKKKKLELEFEKIDDELLKLPKKMHLGDTALIVEDIKINGKSLSSLKSELFHDEEKCHKELWAKLHPIMVTKPKTFTSFSKLITEHDYARALRTLVTAKDQKALASDDPAICYKEDQEVLSCLCILLTFRMKLKINLDERTGDEKLTALHRAAMKKNMTMYALLIENGANPNVPNAAGITAAQLYESTAAPPKLGASSAAAK